jgi:mannose-1-phosphate guanylyltransferase
MLQETALRLQHKEDVSEKSIVVCNEAHRFMVAEQLREINAPARIILEPEGRNTAPAAALAAMFSLSEQKEGEDSPVLLVMPADHVIEDVNTFSRAVDVGVASAAHGILVTFGVVPTYPHTGYGYIESEGRSLVATPINSPIPGGQLSPGARKARARNRRCLQ